MRTLLIILSSIILVGCANHTTVRQHKNFNKLTASTKTVTIIPLVAKRENITNKNKFISVPERDKEIINELPERLASALQQEGFSTDVNLHYLNVKNTPLYDAYFIAHEHLYKQPLAKDKAVRTEQAISPYLLTQFDQSDLVLVVVYQEYGQTTGRYFSNLLISSFSAALMGNPYQEMAYYAESGTYLGLMLVSPKTGDIVWSNSIGTGHGHRLAIRHIVRQAFDGYPLKVK